MKISPQIADWNENGQNASVCTFCLTQNGRTENVSKHLERKISIRLSKLRISDILSQTKSVKPDQRTLSKAEILS